MNRVDTVTVSCHVFSLFNEATKEGEEEREKRERKLKRRRKRRFTPSVAH